jgi:hypothetical protein
MRKQFKKMIISNTLLIIALFSFSIVSASEKDNQKENKDIHEKEFNAGTMIIEHIVDAYEWHILSYKKTHVSVPLPIILYDKGKITAFFSSKFHPTCYFVRDSIIQNTFNKLIIWSPGHNTPTFLLNRVDKNAHLLAKKYVLGCTYSDRYSSCRLVFQGGKPVENVSLRCGSN